MKKLLKALSGTVTVTGLSTLLVYIGNAWLSLMGNFTEGQKLSVILLTVVVGSMFTYYLGDRKCR